MNENIKSITKVDAENLGYEILTDKQKISIFIDNGGDCCEKWGVITTEDTIQYYIGCDLLDIKVIDGSLSTHQLTKDGQWYKNLDSEGAVFVDVYTSNGVLQFVLYNCHNGWYEHAVKVESEQLKYTGSV